jgi:hypothetical protein
LERVGTGNENETDPYDPDHCANEISTNGNSQATSEFNQQVIYQSIQQPNQQFSQQCNQQFNRKTNNEFGCQDDDFIRIAYDLMLEDVRTGKSGRFWCKCMSDGFQCTICGTKCTRRDNLKRHVEKRTIECKTKWNEMTGVEQWGIFGGMAAGL